MPGEWVTLREAARQAGVSISALRKWYTDGTIQKKTEKGPYGPQILVKLDQVTARTRRRRDAVDARTAAVHDPDRTVTALAAAVETIASLTGRLAACQERLSAAERALEQVAGSRYAASILIEGEQQPAPPPPAKTGKR